MFFASVAVAKAGYSIVILLNTGDPDTGQVNMTRGMALF